VSHLGALTSALVDGELTGPELDRASAHLASCPACQAEVAQLRWLKSELSTLARAAGAEACGTDALTRRLLAMPGPRPTGPGTTGHTGGTGGRDPLAPRPVRRAPGRRGSRRRGRYALWGAVSLVVAGVGAAAFGMGGASGTTGRPVTPQLEMLDLQHAINSGDVPLGDPARPLAKAAARR
jgi:anti-sigma factor RsiW